MYKTLIFLFAAAVISSCNTDKKEKADETKAVAIVNKAEQKKDSANIKHFFNAALTEGKSYEWLRDLTQNIGGRLSGSPQAAKAVVWGEQLMKDVGLDSVWLQPVMVPHWVRGEKEKAYYTINGKKKDVPVCALGFSIATPATGIKAEVIEVKSLKEAEELGDKLKGKIVFFNGAFDETLINTFQAYGGCVGQRFSGARICGQFGAKGVIVRSMTNGINDYPHTGTMSYGEMPKEQYIPAAAISSRAAENLSADLKKNPSLQFYFKQSCETLPDAPSLIVVGDIK